MYERHSRVEHIMLQGREFALQHSGENSDAVPHCIDCTSVVDYITVLTFVGCTTPSIATLQASARLRSGLQSAAEGKHCRNDFKLSIRVNYSSGVTDLTQPPVRDSANIEIFATVVLPALLAEIRSGTESL